MALKKSQRIDTLRKIAEWQERDAGTIVSECQRRLQMEQQQLTDLQGYYRGYLNTIEQQKNLARTELINYRNFCQQLARTIEQGQQKVATLTQLLETRKNEWLVKRNKRRVLEELIQRCRDEESQWLEGELQKELDDIWQSSQSRDRPFL